MECLFFLWFSPSALGWDRVGATWPEMPVRYVLSDDASLTDEEIAAIEAAFATWDAVDCADVSFVSDGRAQPAFGVVDGQSWVGLIRENWPDEASLLSAPALTTSGAEMIEADIALNAQWHTFVTDGADGRLLFDLQAAITHEIGHMLGLWHSTVPGATLNPAFIGDPEGRTLEPDDIEGLCALYPGAAGGGGLGAACSETSDCRDDLQCVADASESYCAPPCGAEGECPDGYTCLETAGEEVCARKLGCGCQSANRSPLFVLPWLLWAVRRKIQP